MKVKYILIFLVSITILFGLLSSLFDFGGNVIQSFDGNSKKNISLILNDIYYDKLSNVLLEKIEPDFYSVIVANIHQVQNDSLHVFAHTEGGYYLVDVLTKKKTFVPTNFN